jgi:hypothetical protein
VGKIDVKVPDIGDFKEVPIIEIFVKPGDAVKVEQSLLTLESDKATMDVPSPANGTVGQVLVKIGFQLRRPPPPPRPRRAPPLAARRSRISPASMRGRRSAGWRVSSTSI